ncbi:hypothetical protein niasHT_014717 [Heterodera trifolii]|uniref:DNA-directed DNA polymerase n=1 Tax=Heterodera trifolii TaxID=157864 RepID=A0ABD2KWW4_9BILA
MPKPVNVRRPIVVATRRHLKVGRARKENVEQLQEDDDDDDHDHETPKTSSSNKRQPTQTEIIKLIYKNAQSLGVSEEGQVLRAAIIMDLKKFRLLEFLYKDLRSPVAFTSVEPLLKEARKSQPKINRTDVQIYLATQRTYTLHRQAKRRYRRLPTLAPGLHTEWQADLAIFDRLAKQNRGYSYLLVCIDTLSRQVFVEPVKTKTSVNMIRAFGRIFKRSKYIPWKVLTDQGKEFTARAVQQFFRAKDVEHFCMLTSPQFHAGMAERANRSIKERLYRYFTERNTYKWIDVVQDFVRAINHSPNSSIGMCPADVNFKNAEALRQKLHNSAENVVRHPPKYSVGDRVRIEKYKHVFQKGYLPRFTNELFTVAEVHTERSPVVYRLRDDKNEIISGWFYTNHDPELKRRYDAVFVPCPLDPRNDALRGGRTEPFKLHHVCSDDEEILCIDIVSLYPHVMKANRFPVGNPRVVTREVLLHPPTAPLPWTTPDNNKFRGLLLVRVLAPRNIRVPLLGYRTKDGRFTFPLCGWCADRRQQRPCRHGADRRSWVTAYTHVELNKALQLGYVVTDLFEVWDYDEWDGTLFSSYVNTFVGLKVQATGWPEGCVTEEQRQAFVEDFERTEDIRLDSSKVEFNPGLRLIAKTLANSLWGKLAQRVGQTEIRYTRTPAEFHKLLDDPTLDKLDFVHVSDHMDRCVVRKRPEFAKAPLTNCLPVAAFVTSYGRLQLYSYMEQVLTIDGAELLYCDTDSIYYVKKMCGPCVAEGEALGQMKREHSDRRIVEFIAGGPKNYGIRHTSRDGTDERANLKIRSFRLSYAAEQLINFEAMKDLTLSTYNIDGPIDDVLDNDDPYVYGGGEHRAIRVNFPQIDRNVYADLFTREAHKDYRPYYAKGRVCPGMQTRPFGYVEDGLPNDGQRTQRRKRNLVDHDPAQPGHSGWF